MKMQTDQQTRARLNMGLRNLAAWCEKRAGEEHDTATTLSMLRRKAEELRAAVYCEGERSQDSGYFVVVRGGFLLGERIGDRVE